MSTLATAPMPVRPERSPLGILFLLGGAAHVAGTLPIFAAPFIAREFGLDDRELALLTGVISLGSFGTFALARLADRRGRRLVMRIGFAALAPLSLATALVPVAALYAAAQMAAAVFRGALSSVVSVSITEVSGERARARSHGWYGLVVALANTLPLGLAAALGDRENGWRIAFASVGAVVIVLPWVWRRTPESWRFEKSRAGGGTPGACESCCRPPGGGARSGSGSRP